MTAENDSSLDTDYEYEGNADHELFKSKLSHAQEAADTIGVEIPIMWREREFVVAPGQNKNTRQVQEEELIKALSVMKNLSASEEKVL